jgi:hypothetical protein
VTDPVRAAADRHRARKRGQQLPADEPTPTAAPLVSQGSRSQLPPMRPQETPDDLLRAAAWEVRGRPSWVRIDP